MLINDVFRIKNKISYYSDHKNGCRTDKRIMWMDPMSAELTKTHSFRLLFLAILPTGN